MAVPDFQSLMLPLLRLTADGEQHTLAEAEDHLATAFQLSEEDRKEVLKSGQTRLYNRMGWSRTYLAKAGLLQSVGPGLFRITQRGRDVLASNPASIDVAYLESRFPEMAEFSQGRSRSFADDEPASFDHNIGTWSKRPAVRDRLKEKLEALSADPAKLNAALELMAFAIETADEERRDAWVLREADKGVRLMTGRLIACALIRNRIRVALVGPVTDDLRESMAMDLDAEEEFKSVPGAFLVTFPFEHAVEALPKLKDSLGNFIELAMTRVRSAVGLEDHCPEAVDLIGASIGRTLPQPVPFRLDELDVDDDEGDREDIELSREPRSRGRAPIFEHGQRSIASLVSDIERQVIALPELQRPFVWEDTKVRDLLDSLFLGFPVGTLVLWHTADEKEARAIGAERPGLRASTLVIDGQQRLTSLYAVTKGIDVMEQSGVMRKITIAFRPRDGRFEVADAAIRKDPEFLPSITELWSGGRTKTQIRRDMVNALRDHGRVIDDRYEDAMERNLERAHAIGEYRLPTVDIRKTAANKEEEVTEEDVAEIFVRINNQGTRLGQVDFVLTLLSVFHGPLRDRIEQRAQLMSKDAVVAIDTQQLLRTVCGVAFKRARMSAVYRFLRGVDPTTGATDVEGRKRRLMQLDDAANECTELTPWRDYLLRVTHAGFVSPNLIASKNAIVNGYALYVLGRRAGVPKSTLDAALSRWIFGTLLTARYSASSETVFEQDLDRVARAASADDFVGSLDAALGEIITGDFWNQSLVGLLETQRARAPAALAFRAAQVVLGARALFSDQQLRNLFDPPSDAPRSAREAHHLFPEAWLYIRGIRDRRMVNQVANLTETGWHENNTIGARGPADYVPRLREKLRIDDDRWGRICAEHALPPSWETMDYVTFLRERRRRMADVVRAAYRQLGGEPEAPPIAPPWFLPGSEVVWQRIADTERALRRFVREVYSARYGEAAAQKIEATLSPPERDSLARALRNRPSGADALSVVDYLTLGQLPNLLFAGEVWNQARSRLGGGDSPKVKLQDALKSIVPIRNEIAHVREVDSDRLMRASVACSDVLGMISPTTT